MAKRDTPVALRPIARQTPINPDAQGRQFGVLQFEHAERGGIVSARQVPYAQIAHGHGPSVAIIAHARADSLDAALVVSELMRKLDTTTVSGRLRLISSFTPEASDSERVSLQSAVISQVLPGSDLVIELGGDPPEWEWCGTATTRHTGKPSTAADAMAEQARQAFGAPMSLSLCLPSGFSQRPDICLDQEPATPAANPEGRDSLVHASQSLGIAHLRVCTGSNQEEYSRRDMIRIGCQNVLTAVGLLDQALTLRASRQFRCQPVKDTMISPIGGVLHMSAKPGYTIYRGDTLAHIVDPAAPWLAPTPITVNQDAVIIAARRGSLIAAGDAIALLADEVHA